jgi:hypothetical protein
MRRASLQQVRRAKQTANVLRTIGSRHVESFPRLMEVEKLAQLFKKQRNSIGAKSERQGTPGPILPAGGQMFLQCFD